MLYHVKLACISSRPLSSYGLKPSIRSLHRNSKPSSPTTLTVNHVHDTLLFQIPSLQDIAGREVMLLRSTQSAVTRTDGEMATLILIQEPTEH